MSSMVLAWTEIKVYAAEIGPQRGRPERPRSCPFCDAQRVWYDGWRIVFSVVLVDGGVHRVDEGLALQRVVCAVCSVSWTLLPPFLYPHRSFALDTVEAAALTYLATATATYKQVAKACACSARSVWRWVGWLATIASPAALVAEAEREQSTGESAALIPREVPQAHAKAYSAARERVLLLALQTLCVLGVLARAQVVPAADPSALRRYLIGRLQMLGEVRLLARPNLSPPRPVEIGVPKAVKQPP